MTDELFYSEPREWERVKRFKTPNGRVVRDAGLERRGVKPEICLLCGALVGGIDRFVTDWLDDWPHEHYYDTPVDGKKIHEDYHRRRGDIE